MHQRKGVIALQLLEERILRDGQVKAGGILKVDSFLNHQIDTRLSYEMAREFYNLFAGCGINKILTIEASGIGLACLTGYVFGCPVLFAKKSRSANISADVYSAQVPSFTHGNVNTVMRTKDTNIGEMTNMMVGRPVSLNIDRPAPENSKPRLEVKHITVLDEDGVKKLDDVSFTANTGEILGIAGISGCGQKELLEAIAGLQPVEKGSIEYLDDDGARDELIGKNPLDIAKLGVSLSFVPEDRLGMKRLLSQSKRGII